MYQFIFITGPGRCGTNVMAALLDGHSKIDVLGEIKGRLNNRFLQLWNSGTARLSKKTTIPSGRPAYIKIMSGYLIDSLHNKVRKVTV